MRNATLQNHTLRAVAVAAALLAPSLAAAAPAYPGEIAKHLGLASAPPCSLCHQGSPGSGTATTPFALAMKGAGLDGSGEAAVLDAALDAVANAKTDSDGDDTPDIDELKAGTDPNKAGGSLSTSPIVDPTYGCVATIARPGTPTPKGGWLVVGLLGAAAALSVSRRRRARLAVAAPLTIAAMAGASACYESSFVSSSVCASQIEWTGGDTGSPRMNPGHACITCHESKGEGPRFGVAGTVYAALHETDSCTGLRDAHVIITDADGKSVDITTNEAGNFYVRGDVKKPYRAKVVVNGKESAMTSPQMNGDCNGCHSKDGSYGAPGRVTVP